jgi:ABC-type uncharacterized transport system permease subunit
VLAGAAGSAVAVLPGILREYFQFSAVDSCQAIFWIAAIASLAVIVLTLPIRENHVLPAKQDVAPTRPSTRKLIGHLWLTIWRLLGQS